MTKTESLDAVHTGNLLNKKGGNTFINNEKR